MGGTAMYRRKFTKEFKEAAIGKLRRGTPEVEVAQACQVNRRMLRRWQRELNEYGARAFGGYGKSRHLQAEPKSKGITVRLSADELTAVITASSAAGFASLTEFARFRMFRETGERSPAQVRTMLDELTAVVRKLTERLPSSP